MVVRFDVEWVESSGGMVVDVIVIINEYVECDSSYGITSVQVMGRLINVIGREVDD